VPASEKANKPLSSVGSDLNSSAEPFIPQSAAELSYPSAKAAPSHDHERRFRGPPADHMDRPYSSFDSRRPYPPRRQDRNDAYRSADPYSHEDRYDRYIPENRYPTRDDIPPRRDPERGYKRPDRYESVRDMEYRKKLEEHYGVGRSHRESYRDSHEYDLARRREYDYPPDDKYRRPDARPPRPRSFPDRPPYDSRDRPRYRGPIDRYGDSRGDPRDAYSRRRPPTDYPPRPSSGSREIYRGGRDTVQSLFEKVEREKYGDIVASSLEKNPWDVVGRPKARNHGEDSYFERNSAGKSKLRTEFSIDGSLHVFSKDSRDAPDPAHFAHAARERRKRELQAAKLKDFGLANRTSPSYRPHQSRVENVDFEIANTLNDSPHGRRKYERQLKQQELSAVMPEPRSTNMKVMEKEDAENHDDPHFGAKPTSSSTLPDIKTGENKNWKKQLGVTEDIGANRWIRLRKQEDGIYTKGDPTLRKSMVAGPEEQGLVKAKMEDSKYAPSIRVKSKRRVKFEYIASGVVVVRNAIDPDTQIWLVNIAKKEGSKPDHGFWVHNKNGTKTLNSTGYRGRIYDKLETYEDGEELKHYARSLCARTREQHPSLPMVHPTHLLLLHYATDKGIGWHADDAENDGQNDHPIISFCLGNACKFGIRPLWKHYTPQEIAKMSTEEYKKESYATDPQYIDLASGDVILWGGINRMLVHNVEEVYPNTAPGYLRQLCKNVRYNFTFRDCSNIAGREEEFKYYIPSQGNSEETRNFRTFEL